MEWFRALQFSGFGVSVDREERAAHAALASIKTGMLRTLGSGDLSCAFGAASSN